MIPVEYKYVLVIDDSRLYVHKVIGFSSVIEDDKIDIYVSFANSLQPIRLLYSYATAIVVDSHTLMLHIDIILKEYKRISYILTSCGIVFTEFKKSYPTRQMTFVIE